ncbi:hypothetical protein QCA50_004075 [Cerrena zonata]|uniref:FCP1 homology domain-containing protein n=1 Tax=Cerrena zonata TaxID=2478898 RepID=A0AAW0GMY5_9APHY
MASPQPQHSPPQKGKELQGESVQAQPAEGLSAQDTVSKTSTTPIQDTSSSSRSDVPNGKATTSSAPSDASKQGQVSSSPEQSSSASNVPTSLPPNATVTTTAPTKEKSDDADKDRASLNTTLTGTQTHTHQSTQRKAETSDAAHTASSTHEETRRSKSPSKSKKKKAAKNKNNKKASVFSRLFHVFVPCVGPSPRYHDESLDNDKPAQPAPEESAPATTSQEKEKSSEKRTDETAPSQPNGKEQHEVEAQNSEDSESLPAPLQPIQIPEQTDPAVVVPPTPTRSVLPQDETEGVTSGAVVPPGSTGTPTETHHHEHRTHTQDSENESDGSTSFTEEEDLDDGSPLDDIEDDEERLILQGGAGIPIGPDGIPRPLLPPVSPKHAGRKCLVLDLDETLVHSSFKSISQADYVVPVEIEYHWHNVYVIKRPGVDNFLKKMGEIYEIVVFTASLSKYADPVLDKLDIHRVVSHRLFRESCYNHRGNYVKDLSQLGRPIEDTIILDNSPASYIFHPNNAVPVSSWFTDPHDQELSDLCPFLTDLATVDDVRGVLDGGL